MLGRLGAAFKWAATTHPVKFNSLTTSVLFFGADATCQHFERKAGHGTEWNVARSAKASLIGCFVSGPLDMLRLRTMERLSPGQTVKAMAGKIAIGLSFAPVMISSFLTSTLLLNGKTVEEIVPIAQYKVPRTFAAAACYWPFVNVFLFYAVPAHTRPVVSAGFGFVWQILNSYMANSKIAIAADGRVLLDDEATDDAATVPLPLAPSLPSLSAGEVSATVSIGASSRTATVQGL